MMGMCCVAKEKSEMNSANVLMKILALPHCWELINGCGVNSVFLMTPLTLTLYFPDVLCCQDLSQQESDVMVTANNQFAATIYDIPIWQ
eukprot:12375932-Ditylum_brightwellii.AAC.1